MTPLLSWLLVAVVLGIGAVGGTYLTVASSRRLSRWAARWGPAWVAGVLMDGGRRG